MNTNIFEFITGLHHFFNDFNGVIQSRNDYIRCEILFSFVWRDFTFCQIITYRDIVYNSDFERLYRSIKQNLLSEWSKVLFKSNTKEK